VSKKESVAAAPASPVVSGTSAGSPVTAQEPGKGTITVDGETRSFVVEECRSLTSGAQRVDGRAKDEAGYTVVFRLRDSRFTIDVYEPERSRVMYMNLGSDAEDMVFRVDGSTVSVDGLFRIGNNYAPLNTSIQMSFDCSG
jgi:hypothetical protein